MWDVCVVERVESPREGEVAGWETKYRWTHQRCVGRGGTCLCRSLIGDILEFIMGLEKDYPSTVSTITRTCSKLASKDEPAGTCSICQRYDHGRLCSFSYVRLMDEGQCKAV